MRDTWKKIVLVFTVCIFVCMQTITVSAASTSSTVSRAEWIHDLVTTFNMTIEDGLMPDDYYTDINQSKYYNDILLAVNFGVIDLEAGEQFCPDDLVTREFAVQTLNACLGYELDEEAEYTMSDYVDLQYPQAAQIAINEEWLKLINGAFEPGQTITATEKNNMLSFAKAVLKATVVEEDHENVYKFADNIIEIPEETSVELLSPTEIMIYDTSLDLSKGDSIAVYSNGIAYTYKIVEIEEQTEGIHITGEEIAYEDAIVSVDAEGIIDADLGNFVPADGVTVYTEYEEPAATYGLGRIGGTQKVKDIVVKKNIGGGTASCKLTNMKIHYRINSKGYKFSTTGTAVASYTISGKKDFTLTLGYINIAGVGKVSVDMIYSADGSATLSYSYNFETGIEKNFGSPTRKVKSYTIPTWHFSATAQLKVSCKVGFYVNVPGVANGSIYGEAGVKADPDIEVYGDGKKPKMCMDLPTYIFATVGYNLSVFDRNVAGETIEIYNQNNSPCRVYFHIEDGKQVHTCSRPESSSHVGKRGYYSVCDVGSGTYSANCFVAPSADAVQPIFEYELDEDDNATITKYNGTVAYLTIPEKLDGYPVVGIGANAFKGNTYLQSVVIPDGVTSIGKYAFEGCNKLADIVLPSNSKFTSIGEGAFKDTVSLQRVEMSEYITSIASQAFYGSGLTYMHLNDNITQIGNKAFYGCKSLEDLVLPQYLEGFGGSCFGDCDALQTVEIPKYITGCSDDLYPNGTGGYGYSSPAGMFSGCDNLKTITFAKGVTKIGVDLFNGCTGLEEITLPDTITEIQSKAFYNCDALKKINLPKSLTKIGILSFAGCDSLEEIDIPDAVTVIDCRAFASCDKLSNVKLSARLKEIGTWAFSDCTSIQEIEIPKTVSSVIRYYDGMTINKLSSPFEGCTGLKKAVLQEGMKNVPAHLFRWCTEGLEEVVIPDSVISIGEGTFNSCKSLKTIKLPVGLVSLGEYAFIACSSLEQIEIPDTVNSMGESLFENCAALANVKLPRYRVGIANSCFKNCTSLKKIEFPNTLQYIYSSAFEGCENLESISVPDGFKGIESYAFKNCKKLSSVILKGDYIGNYAFENCYELNDVKMDDSIYTIGESVFLNCNSLETLKLSNGLTTIGKNAFQGCTYLDNVVIPYGVTSIKDNTFKNCTKLNKITILKNVSEISDNAFSYFDEVTVYGVSGSYAEEYANENGMIFVGENIAVTSVEFSKEQYNVTEGYSIKIPISISPNNCTEDVVYTSSDEKVATVDNTGKVQGKSVGECEITVSVGTVRKTCKIIVKKRYYSLKLMGKNEIEIGGKQTLICSSGNSEVPAEELRWWSSDPEIVTIDQKGNMIALSDGAASIEVWLIENTDYKDKFTITVKKPKNVPVTGISLNKTSLEMETKTTATISANILPADATNTNVTWKSDNEDIASVVNGKITAKKAGTATITATTQDGSYSASCVVTVTGHGVTGVELSKESMSIEEGNCALLEVIITPENADDSSVTWQLEDETIATVDTATGIVKGLQPGTTSIKVITTDGGYEAACEVEVTAADDSTEKIEVSEVNIQTDCEDLSDDNKIEIGREFTLNAIVQPTDATNSNIFWISSNKNVASISQEGVVTTKGIGEVTFIAVSESGAKQAELTIEVVPIAVTSVSLDSHELVMKVGEKGKLTASLTPENATNQEVSWSTSRRSIVSVDAEGNIKANAVGTATIAVTTVDGEYKDSCVITVNPVLVSSVELDIKTLAMKVGDKKKINATVLPQNATDKTIVWSSSNTKVLNVDKNGNVSAIGVGNANILAMSADGSEVMAQCTVTVSEEQKTSKPVTTEQDKPESTLPIVGTQVTVGNGTYKVTKSTSSVKEVTYVKPKSKNKTSVSISDTIKINGFTYKVTSVSANALSGNKKVTKVTVGKNVTSIGKNAFKKCTKLKTVTLKSTSLKSIGSNAFYGDKNLKTITIKSSKLTSKSVGKNAFKGTNKKLTIKVPKKKVSSYKKFLKKKGNKKVIVKKG